MTIALLMLVKLNAQVSIPTIKIGDQQWSSVNLKTDRFLNGDLIPEAKNADEWSALSKKGVPVRMINQGEVFYNWHTVIDPRGLAPAGFKIPAMLDWYNLLDYQMTHKIPVTRFTSRSGWADGKNGTDSVGFHAAPSGFVNLTGNSGHFSISGNFWSTTDANASKAYYVRFHPDQSTIKIDTEIKRYGFQIRLIKIPTQTRIGSREYKTARIGTYEWMLENLDENEFENALKLPEAKSFNEWNNLIKSESPAWAYYEFDPSNKYLGRYYNYYAILEFSRLWLDGWTVPELKHWENLISHIGGWKSSAHLLRGGNIWRSGTKVSNSWGFNAWPAGIINAAVNEFEPLGGAAVWWMKENGPGLIGIADFEEDVVKEHSQIEIYMDWGIPLRLVKTDRETNPYSTFRKSETTWNNEEAALEINSIRDGVKDEPVYKKHPILLECAIANLKATHTFDEYRFIAESEFALLFTELIQKCVRIHKVKIEVP